MAFLLKCVYVFVGISLLSITAAFANCVDDPSAFKEPVEARTEEVEEGANITLKCVLMDSKDDGTDCQWNYMFKTKVEPIYPDTNTKKYHFANYSEQRKDCSIMIRNVTEGDEGDWKCTYMHGTQGQQVCAKPITLQLKKEATEDPLSSEEEEENTGRKVKETPENPSSSEEPDTAASGEEKKTTGNSSKFDVNFSLMLACMIVTAVFGYQKHD